MKKPDGENLDDKSMKIAAETIKEEYFDVLDENGQKTGERKLRKEVHRDGDWHKAIHIWVIDEDGNILLQRRASDKDSNPNMLDISCTGHLSAGDESAGGGYTRAQRRAWN